MKMNFTRLILCFSLLGITLPSISSTSPNHVTPLEFAFKKLASMKLNEFGKLMGRRLTLKEKAGFWVVRQKARHFVKKGIPQEKIFKPGKAENSGSLGQTSMIIGIVAAALLVIGLFVPTLLIGALVASIIAIVLGSSAAKKDKSDRKAFVGKLLGWITLGLLVGLIIAVALIIASWSWGWE